MATGERRQLRETDLYNPLRDYLVAHGHTVRGEVKGCDITAIKGEELVVIELKRSFSADLLLQATQRQRMADSVYVALPKPDGGMRNARWRHIEHLLRRLELGLIFVSFSTGVPTVEVILHPLPFAPRRDTRERRAILAEMAGRSGDHNQGGSTRRGILTAYRESAVFVACCLERFGPLSPSRLHELGAGPRCQAILSRNVYRWFERHGAGLYGLTPQGKDALQVYGHLVAQFRAALDRPFTIQEQV